MSTSPSAVPAPRQKHLVTKVLQLVGNMSSTRQKKLDIFAETCTDHGYKIGGETNLTMAMRQVVSLTSTQLSRNVGAQNSS